MSDSIKDMLVRPMVNNTTQEKIAYLSGSDSHTGTWALTDRLGPSVSSNHTHFRSVYL